MPKESKPEPAKLPPSEEADEQSAWAEDQKKHEYYYDDSHGYVTYKSDEDECSAEKPPVNDTAKHHWQ